MSNGIYIGNVGGFAAIVGATFNRPADTTAYAIGDLIGDVTSTNPAVTPLSLAVARVNNGTGMVRRVRLKTTDTGATLLNATVRVHFFRDSPTPTVGDNGVFNASNVLACNESNYLGYVDVTLDKQFSDYTKGIDVPTKGSEINFDTAVGSMSIYALLEARTAITPGSAKTWSLVLEVLQN